MYEKNNSWAMRKLFWGAGAICLEHSSSTGTTSKTTHSCSTFITYYWAIKSFPWRIQWKFCLTRFFCRWVPAPSRDLCCLTMMAFYCVLFTFCFLPLCNCLSDARSGPTILLNALGLLFSMQLCFSHPYYQYSSHFLFIFSWDDSHNCMQHQIRKKYLLN